MMRLPFSPERPHIMKAVSEIQTTFTTRALLLLLALLLLCLPVRVQAAEQAGEPQWHVLLVYDSLAIGTPIEGNIEALRRLLSAAGAQVLLQNEDGYYTGQLNRYTAVVQIRNQTDLPASEALNRDLANYNGNYLHIGAELPENARKALKLEQDWADFGKVVGKLGYAPSYMTGAEDERQMAELLANWLGLGEEQALYLLIKEVYPFSDLTLLVSLSDRMHEAGIPFMLAVRPVFANLQSPAMKRYIDAIRYAQSKGGSILVQAPVVASTISNADGQLQEKLSMFIDVLAETGIAPLGMVSELYWSYDRVYAEDALSLFDSVVLLPDEKRMHRDQSSESMSFASSLFTLADDNKSAWDAATSSFRVPAVHVIDMPDSTEGLETIQKQLIESWVQFDDYRYKEHTTTTLSNMIASAAGVLTINGKTIGLEMNVPVIGQDEVGTENEEENNSLSLENNILIVIIIISLLIFGYFIYLGYGMYKRKYYK